MRLWVHGCSKTILTSNCCLPYESFEHFMVLYNYPKFQEYVIFFAKEIRNKILKSIYWFGYPQGIYSNDIFLRSFILSSCKYKIYFYKYKCVQKRQKCGKASNSVHRKDSILRASHTIFDFLLPHLIIKVWEYGFHTYVNGLRNAFG